jgi:hypothetical protein
MFSQLSKVLPMVLGTLQDAINRSFELSKQINLIIQDKSNMNTKQLPSVQSVLCLDDPGLQLRKTDLFNAEPVDAVNRIRLAIQTSALPRVAAANANTELNELTASAGIVASMEFSIDMMLTACGIGSRRNNNGKTIALSVKSFQRWD